MTEVASLALCKELYELSGWGTDRTWRKLTLGKAFVRNGSIEDEYDISPAYSLGYLLRKLPNGVNIMYNSERSAASYEVPIGELLLYGNTPENAACKLSIELFKLGVLK